MLCELAQRHFPFLILSMPVLKTVVAPEAKGDFCAKAKAHGLTESELLRAIILAAVGEDDRPRQRIEPDVERITIERMTVRMPRFLMEATKQRAKATGMAPSRWIASLVQSNLTGQPVMTEAELAALHASARELAALGRNINQIARAINAAFHEVERVRLDRLELLSQAIADNRAAIRALVRASQGAWDAH